MEENNFEEMELKDIFMIIWKRKVLLALVAVAIVIIGSLVTIVLPEKIYRSEMAIEVSGPSLRIGSTADESIQNILNETIKTLDINFDSYATYILEDEVLENTIEDLSLADKYSASTLRSKLTVIPDVANQAITVKFGSADPKEPPLVLNSLTENFMEFITDKVKKNSEEVLITLKEQTEIEKEKYETIFETYESFINGNKSVDEYEMERQAMTKQIVDFRTALKNLEIKEEGIKAAIKENDSSGQSSSGAVLQTGDGSVYIGNAKKGLAINLAEVVAMKDATAKSINKLEEEIKQTNLDYQRAEVDAISINQKLKISKESYESFAKTYETIDTISSFDKGKLGISISSEPKEAIRIKQSIKLKLLMLIVIGIAFATVTVFVKEYMEVKKNKDNTL